MLEVFGEDYNDQWKVERIEIELDDPVTLLHAGIRGGHPSVVKWLLEQGASTPTTVTTRS